MRADGRAWRRSKAFYRTKRKRLKSGHIFIINHTWFPLMQKETKTPEIRASCPWSIPASLAWRHIVYPIFRFLSVRSEHTPWRLFTVDIQVHSQGRPCGIHGSQCVMLIYQPVTILSREGCITVQYEGPLFHHHQLLRWRKVNRSVHSEVHC